MMRVKMTLLTRWRPISCRSAVAFFPVFRIEPLPPASFYIVTYQSDKNL